MSTSIYKEMKNTILGIMTLATLFAGVTTSGVELEQIVSREDPKFHCAQATMTIGRDGQIYLASSHTPAYVLRVSRDGQQKLGGDVIYALQNATANADGVIATANGHFNRSVNIYDAAFNHMAKCDDFLVNDTVGYDAPRWVEAGASGDFYGLDRHRHRILRIKPDGRVTQAYPVTNSISASEFRVCESTRTFYVFDWWEKVIYGVDFDGAILWQHPSQGLFNIDSEGAIYVLNGNSLQRLMRNPENKNALVEDGSSLDLGVDPAQLTGAKQIGLLEGELFVKRSHPTELFQVYDLASGALIRTIHKDHERFTAEFPSLVWTAGAEMPLTIRCTADLPQVRVWITPFGDNNWRELNVEDDQITVPADFAGLYLLKIAPALNPQATPEYMLREIIEVRASGSQGTVSVWTPRNQIWFGRGENIAVNVSIRPDLPDEAGVIHLRLRSVESSTVTPDELWTIPLDLEKDQESGQWDTSVTLPAHVTATLAHGRYELRADLPGFTSVPQPIRIGPGDKARNPFRVTLHADYENFNSTASVWEFADVAQHMLTASRALGVNQYVNRIFVGRYQLDFSNTTVGRGLLRNLDKRFRDDPDGVAPEKIEFGFPQAHVLGAFGAHGIRELLLLVGMDAALPIGTSTGYARGNSPEAYAKMIKDHTTPLKDFAAFYGWTWTANWWVTDPSKRFESPEQQQDYTAALKQARETGVWDPVLDIVAERVINWPVEAQEGFGQAMREVAPDLTTANAGPYRRPEIYPPTTFSNVDEVDLHFQAEQITAPNWTAHAPDFYKRPGKPAWMHPELYNDSGTGEKTLPMGWLAIMRGVDGIGAAGKVPHWGAMATDSRSGYAGTASIFRSLARFANEYGPWLTTLENADRIAIVVSQRQIKLDGWASGGVGGLYFTRLWEAHQACLHARRPATFLYAEDVKSHTLAQFDALLLIGQDVEPEPALAKLLADARRQGLTVFHDDTCRESLVNDLTPLNIAFDQVEKLHGFNNDMAYWDFPERLIPQGEKLAAVLEDTVPPVGTCDHPEVLLSERRSDDARFVWVVNNSYSKLDPGLLWRVQNAIATRTPVVAEVSIPVGPDEVVYDLFEQREITGTRNESRTLLTFDADLRFSHARLYAILPRRIASLDFSAPKTLVPGQTVEWTATAKWSRWRNIQTALPMQIRLTDGAGLVLHEEFTTTGGGNLPLPVNAQQPLSLTATELISGQSAVIGAPSDTPHTVHAFGPRIRDIAVSSDGKTALLNAFQWGQNLYAVNVADGTLSWTGHVGDHFAYGPKAGGNTFYVQGYDLHSGEGYHLYALDTHGRATQRFALPGLPSRLTSWAFASILNDRINQFVVAPDGTWVAASGNLAWAVWAMDGTWQQAKDWSEKERKTCRLLAIDNETLIVADGMTLSAYTVKTGTPRWENTLAPSGQILGLTASHDGRLLAARTTERSGIVYLVLDGKKRATLHTQADAAVISPDGQYVAITTGQELKLYSADGTLLWVFKADASLRFPSFSPNSNRLVVSSEIGLMRAFDLRSGDVTTKDFGALPVASWLDNGDLIIATWLGEVARLDSDFNPVWQVNLAYVPDHTVQTVDKDAIPTTRLTSWSSAEPTPRPLTPNLINGRAVTVKAFFGDREIQLQHAAGILFDGEPTPPTAPWLLWGNVGLIDSGWYASATIVIDTFRAQLRVEAITFVEDPDHPESWLRDARLEYWDPTDEKWVFAQYLTSDSPVHTHVLKQPIEAARFRLARPDGTGWPASNLRLGEIVFHGDALGTSHPDALKNSPVAILFDENETDISALMRGRSFQKGGAFSGGTYLQIEADKFVVPHFTTPFGHAIPNWDFEIVENPTAPGQYRWLAFACKGLAPESTGISVRVGMEWPGPGVLLDIGDPAVVNQGFLVRTQVAAELSTEWTAYTVDLWELLPDAMKENIKTQTTSFRIRSIGVGSVGGPVGIDQIELRRPE